MVSILAALHKPNAMSELLSLDSKVTALLVDPNKADRQKVQSQIQNHGIFDLHECHDAEQLLEAWFARLAQLDVIVLEHDLPGNSGLDLSRLLIGEPDCPPLVIFYQAWFGVDRRNLFAPGSAGLPDQGC